MSQSDLAGLVSSSLGLQQDGSDIHGLGLTSSNYLGSEAPLRLDTDMGDVNEQDPSQSANRRAPARRRQLPAELAREVIPAVQDETAELVRDEFESFLESFTEEQAQASVQIYVEQIKQLRDYDRTTLYVNLTHLHTYNTELATAVQRQYYRMEPYLRQAVQKLVAKYDNEYMKYGTQMLAGEDVAMREFWVSFYSTPDVTLMRKIRTENVGQLISIKGTVTRTSEVRPELLFGTFKCLDCGASVKDVEQQFQYTLPTTCHNPTCMNRRDFTPELEKCKFVDWQKVRLQESADEVPSGAMPRSLDVILRHETVERAKAGDKIIVTGYPIVVPDVGQLIGLNAEARRETYGRARDGFGMDGVSGLKALGCRDLTYKVSFLGCFVKHELDKDALSALHDMEQTDEDEEEDVSKHFTTEELAKFQNMRTDKYLQHKLITAVAPHIFGHEDIKKGILLQLLGGVHKVTKEGIHLRGDINICIVGDPSTAKSQFLKYVSSFMPRAVYTSGKASSAAGLTASVAKDEETGEFTIEAGALMLADNGICCIDEFDKMNLVDQVAIHEAMEQQTISIVKAGIQATLNARASILAAANPVRGRYDKKLSLRQNVNMSPPIMSRFDLFFIVLDECNENADWNIATHIVNFHRTQGLEQEIMESDEFTQQDLKSYIKYARSLKPQLTPAAREHLVEKYRQFRQEDAAGVDKSSYRITVRQLESMVRLSEALAKLYGEKQIHVRHVAEAATLLNKSIITIDQDRVELENEDDAAAMAAMDTAEQDVEMNDSTLVKDSLESEVVPTQASSNKIVLDASEYARITKAVIMFIQHQEKSSAEKGVKRSAIVDWYMDLNEESMETEEDVMRERSTILRVLNRLQKKEGTLFEVKNYDHLPELNEDGQVANETTESDPLLTVHSSYMVSGDA